MHPTSRRELLAWCFRATACQVGADRSAQAQHVPPANTLYDDFGHEMKCLEENIDDAPAKVREWLEQSALAKSAKGPDRRVRLCIIEAKHRHGEGWSRDAAKQKSDEMRRVLGRLVSELGVQSNSSSVDGWFRGASIAGSLRDGSVSQVHAAFSNDFELHSAVPLVIKLRSGASMGVNRHPWMSIIGYRPALTLNNAELAALSPTASFFEKQLRFYAGRKLSMAPFPDTERLLPKATHVEAFRRRISNAGLPADEYVLRYIRYYVASVSVGGAKPKAQPILAEAYARAGSPALAINFSLLQTESAAARTMVKSALPGWDRLFLS